VPHPFKDIGQRAGGGLSVNLKSGTCQNVPYRASLDSLGLDSDLKICEHAVVVSSKRTAKHNISIRDMYLGPAYQLSTFATLIPFAGCKFRITLAGPGRADPNVTAPQQLVD